MQRHVWKHNRRRGRPADCRASQYAPTRFWGWPPPSHAAECPIRSGHHQSQERWHARTCQFTVRKFEDGCFDVQITPKFRRRKQRTTFHTSPRRSAVLRNSILGSLKTATGSLTERRPDPVHHALGFGGPLAVRSAAKARVWCRISQLPIRKICSKFITPKSDQKKDGCNVSSRTLLCFGRTPSVFSPHLSGNFGGGAGLLLGL